MGHVPENSHSTREYVWALVMMARHHHWVARPSASITVSTSWRHFERSCARIHAVLRPRLWGWRSSSIVRSHVCLVDLPGVANPREDDWWLLEECASGLVVGRLWSDVRKTKSPLCDHLSYHLSNDNWSPQWSIMCWRGRYNPTHSRRKRPRFERPLVIN